MADTKAISTDNLRKQFGSAVAVRGLTLEVERGEVFGFLGPNGAGKTTSIKMLLGLVKPTAGSALLLGKPITDRNARTRAGFLPEHFRFHDWLTAKEFLTVHGQLFKIDQKRLEKRTGELLELVGLTPFQDKQLRTFSKGMLQRIGLAQALLNEPELVFLDEPTSGLDPVGRRLVRDIIRHLREKGTTVFLNSHLLSEVEITCDRVAFIKHGEVLRVSQVSTLMDGSTTVTIHARGFDGEALTALTEWGRDVRVECDLIILSVNDETALPEINRSLVGRGVDVYSLVPQRLSLEDLFIQVVGTDGGL
ncbi:MAG: ABC transporter ATP-binding protein [Anaerolineaceae bacterium]|nr:ABC transporter ATP-binding protein [Anaerolineaceae bacterium]